MDVANNVEDSFMEDEERQQHKKKINGLLGQTLKKGDTWYLLDTKWFQLWRSYVDSTSKMNNNHPGKITNTNIFESKNGEFTLKHHLIEEMDYKIIPEKAWEELVETFGLGDNQPAFPRKVIEQGLYVKQLSVEIYLLCLTLQKGNDTTNVHVKEYSKVSTIELLYEDFKRLFKIPFNQTFRLISDSNDVLERKEETLVDSGIRLNQTVIMQQKKEDDTWEPLNTIAPAKKHGTSFSFSNGYSLRNGNSATNIDNSEKGLCGLSNIGNTCFMNSALQCLSNVPSLTKYFLRGDYKNDLNPSNPLGMHGKIATAYAKLVKDIWSGNHSSISPREFKAKVGQFAPRFNGYQQQDSQELISFLMDGLHEDLNKIVDKPYIERKDSEGRPVEEVAEESWRNHVARNSSIMVDFFHGLYKSTLVCPDCKKISTTFDPFSFLSLPIPVRINYQCKFVYSDPNKPIEMHSITVHKNETMEEFRKILSKQTKVPAKFIEVADVHNCGFYKVFRDSYVFTEHLDLYAYDMRINGVEEEYTPVKVYLRRAESYSQKLVGMPFLIPMPQGATNQTLYNAVLKSLKRFIKEKLWQETEICEDWQKCEINEEGISTDEEDNKTHKKSKMDELFKISQINTYGSATIRSIPKDETPLNSSETDDYIYAADWEKETWEKYMVSTLTDTYVNDSSYEQSRSKKSGIALDDCLKLFTSTEILGDKDLWYCPSCKDHKKASKKVDLWSLPPVIIVHFKRFSQTRWTRGKIDALVDYPITNLDMSDYIINPIKDKCKKEKYTYNLTAVSNHYGGLGGGHYTAYAKNFLTNKWHYFDDSSVSDAKESSVVTKAAYMLFYQRQDLEQFHLNNDNEEYQLRETAISPRGFPQNQFPYSNSNSEDAMDTC